jgi:hypothetical protein
MENLTPKEKANELFNKIVVYHWTDVCDYEGAKQCALIAVDEVLRSHYNLYGLNNKKVKFYLEVQQEIKLL